MDKLIRIYEQRLNGTPHETLQDLLNIQVRDSKLFYFTLMYWYLTNKDLTQYLGKVASIDMGVELFCLHCKNPTIVRYFQQYFYVDDSKELVDNIINELDVIKASTKLFDKFNLGK